ncbi:hypothetical protein GIB67_017341 [Kingdonia uniflora]|uniref:Uncharacterized protein n=1 Tax=Kingdonia uniflora TaxID=39325 RepID=A0A7J7N5S6_9MAGN|nr:hypothetical protein GIB67_017341 [Kingdonia uniflora]
MDREGHIDRNGAETARSNHASSYGSADDTVGQGTATVASSSSLEGNAAYDTGSDSWGYLQLLRAHAYCLSDQSRRAPMLLITRIPLETSAMAVRYAYPVHTRRHPGRQPPTSNCQTSSAAPSLPSAIDSPLSGIKPSSTAFIPVTTDDDLPISHRMFMAMWLTQMRNIGVKIDLVQLQLEDDIENNNIAEASHNRTADYAKLVVQEEGSWKLKARFKWLTNGDRNTRYFHTLSKIKLAKSQICMLEKDDGVILENQQAIQDYFVDFHNKKFTDANN